MAVSQPTPPRRMRASDQDRNEAILALGDHHAEGRLDLAEFTARMEQAQVATYLDQLDPLFADLPLRARLTPAVPPGRPPRDALRWRARLEPLVLIALVVAAVAVMVRLQFVPIWLVLGLWYFWAFGSRRNRRRWQYRRVMDQDPHTYRRHW